MNKIRYQQINDYETVHWWYVGRRLLLDDFVKRLIVDKKGEILDYGCGTGENIKLLSKFGTVWGVDNDKDAIEFCHQKGLKNLVLLKSGMKLAFAPQYFDLVTCLDVLEHIQDDIGILKQLYLILRNNGWLVLMVPAFPILWNELDIRSHHYRRYSKPDLIQKILGAGFKVEDVFYFNYIFFLPILLLRLLQKTRLFKAATWGVDPVVENKHLNNLIKLIFRFDVFTAPLTKPPFGVSLFVLARKSTC